MTACVLQLQIKFPSVLNHSLQQPSVDPLVVPAQNCLLARCHLFWIEWEMGGRRSVLAAKRFGLTVGLESPAERLCGEECRPRNNIAFKTHGSLEISSHHGDGHKLNSLLCGMK